jgi:hypothetical protein
MFVQGGVRRLLVAGSTAMLALAFTNSSHAVISVNLGGGWIASWDDSFAGLVDVTTNAVTGNAVHIEKTAEWGPGQAPVNGIVPSIPIVFRVDAAYVAANGIGAVRNNIVIDDEALTNSTGVTWTDFHFDLLDHGDVQFDPVATAASGGGGPIGFSIAPFTNAAFANNNTRLNIFGGPGIAGNGGLWFPGSGANDGELWMHINNVTATSQFVLKETPSVPAPGALAMLVTGVIFGSRRRRS